MRVVEGPSSPSNTRLRSTAGDMMPWPIRPARHRPLAPPASVAGASERLPRFTGVDRICHARPRFSAAALTLSALAALAGIATTAAAQSANPSGSGTQVAGPILAQGGGSTIDVGVIGSAPGAATAPSHTESASAGPTATPGSRGASFRSGGLASPATSAPSSRNATSRSAAAAGGGATAGLAATSSVHVPAWMLCTAGDPEIAVAMAGGHMSCAP